MPMDSSASDPDTSTNITRNQEPSGSTSLLNRIGRTRVYAFEDAAPNIRTANQVATPPEDPEEPTDAMVVEDPLETEDNPNIRSNSLLLEGVPISHLPTAKIFAYAAHYEPTPPVALEWICDTKAVIVYSEVKIALKAFRALQRTPSMSKSPEDDPTKQFPAQPVPSQLWPPQMRVASLLAEGSGLSGDITVRRALVTDVKVRGAAGQSQFYKTYGEQAGRDGRPSWETSGSSKTDSNWKRDLWDSAGEDASDTSTTRAGPRRNLRGSRSHGSHPYRGDSGRSRKGGHVTKDDLDAELDAMSGSRT